VNFPPRKIKADLPPKPAQPSEIPVIPEKEVTENKETEHIPNNETK
jgi:hypothetical protein